MKISQVLARAAKLVERTGPPLCRIRKGATCFSCSLADGPVAARIFAAQFAGLRWYRDAGLTGAEAATWLSAASEYAKMLGK